MQMQPGLAEVPAAPLNPGSVPGNTARLSAVAMTDALPLASSDSGGSDKPVSLVLPNTSNDICSVVQGEQMPQDLKVPGAGHRQPQSTSTRTGPSKTFLFLDVSDSDAPSLSLQACHL